MPELAHEPAQNWRKSDAAKGSPGPGLRQFGSPLKGGPISNRRSSSRGQFRAPCSRNRTGAELAQNWRRTNRFPWRQK
jgi:hypothetical protein